MDSNFAEAPVVENKPDRSVTLSDLAYLWKREDPEWVKKREADWVAFVKPVFKDHPKAEQKLLERYFKEGKRDEYYPATGWFFLTPYDSRETLLKVMNSSLLDSGERRSIISYYLFRDFGRFSDCPWYREHMGILREAYFNDGYTVLREKRQVISPSPTWWSEIFVRESIDAINQKAEWYPFFGIVDYFVSILPFAFNLNYREDIQLKQLMCLVDDALDQGKLEGELLEFVKTLKAREHDIWEAWNIGEQKIAAGIKAPREG